MTEFGTLEKDAHGAEKDDLLSFSLLWVQPVDVDVSMFMNKYPRDPRASKKKKSPPPPKKVIGGSTPG